MLQGRKSRGMFTSQLHALINMPCIYIPFPHGPSSPLPQLNASCPSPVPPAHSLTHADDKEPPNLAIKAIAPDGQLALGIHIKEAQWETRVHSHPGACRGQGLISREKCACPIQLPGAGGWEKQNTTAACQLPSAGAGPEEYLPSPSPLPPLLCSLCRRLPGTHSLHNFLSPVPLILTLRGILSANKVTQIKPEQGPI